jgi:hypothetical protein
MGPLGYFTHSLFGLILGHKHEPGDGHPLLGECPVLLHSGTCILKLLYVVHNGISRCYFFNLVGLGNLEQRNVSREAPGDAVGGHRTHALQFGDGLEKIRTHLGDQLAVLVVKRIRNTIISHDLIIEQLVRSVNREGATIGHTKTLRHLLLIQ